MIVSPTSDRNPGALLTFGVCIFLAALVWVAFGGAIYHGFVDYDDGSYVYENPKITGGLSLSAVQWAFTHVHANNWHPLTSISHMLDCQLYGVQPSGHHLNNILLHGATAILLFLALHELTNRFWPSAFVAALFAVHPLRVESVVWVSERKDVLSGVFFMLMLWAYARYCRKDRHRSIFYLIVVLAFALGLMCKPTLVTAPFVLLLLDYWPLGRLLGEWPAVRHRLREKIPLFILSAASCVATLIAQKHALTEVRELPLTDRISNALVSYVSYLGQIVYPARLTVFYPYRQNGPAVSQLFLAFVILLIISALFFLWRRKHPFLLVGWLWFLGMLIPMIGIVQVGQQSRADRYTYLPMIGVCILVTWGLLNLLKKWRHDRGIVFATAVLLIIALVARSNAQTEHWRNTEALWRHAVENMSRNYIAHYTLGNVLAQQQRFDEAIAQYQKSLEIEPNYAQTHNNLGIAFANEGRFGDAITEYEIALRLRPDFVEVHNNLGTILATIGKPEEAIDQFEEALRLRPNYIEVHKNLARLLEKLGRREEAMPHIAEANRLESVRASSK